MSEQADLSEFLKTRRARIQPSDLGVVSVGRRRVPGLRREEIAQVAGVSVDYYVRLEQGRARNVSADVLDAVARALHLDAAEREHLHRLAKPRRRARRPATPQRVRPGVQRLLDSMTDVPAFVLGRRMDVLAWNALASKLIVDFAALEPAERNMPRLALLDESCREIYPDWQEVAKETVAYLRFDASRYPDDPALLELVGELSLRSPEFGRWWARHDVREKSFGTKRMHHPLVGDLVAVRDHASAGQRSGRRDLYRRRRFGVGGLVAPTRQLERVGVGHSTLRPITGVQHAGRVN